MGVKKFFSFKWLFGKKNKKQTESKTGEELQVELPEDLSEIAKLVIRFNKSWQGFLAACANEDNTDQLEKKRLNVFNAIKEIQDNVKQTEGKKDDEQKKLHKQLGEVWTKLTEKICKVPTLLQEAAETAKVGDREEKITNLEITNGVSVKSITNTPMTLCVIKSSFSERKYKIDNIDGGKEERNAREVVWSFVEWIQKKENYEMLMNRCISI